MFTPDVLTFKQDKQPVDGCRMLEAMQVFHMKSEHKVTNCYLWLKYARHLAVNRSHINPSAALGGVRFSYAKKKHSVQ